jgi:nucleotide-binding universal stress UspA family protein
MDLFKHILVPTDGSELSAKAAKRAIVLARAMNARLTFFHAKPERRQSFFGGEGGGYVNQMPAEEFEREAQRLADETLAALQKLAGEAGVDSDRAVCEAGPPYEGIIDAASSRGCDLIVMASHGRRGIKGLILGSETQKVLTHSSVPVLVYR